MWVKRRTTLALLAAAWVGSGAACGSDTTVTEPEDPAVLDTGSPALDVLVPPDWDVGPNADDDAEGVDGGAIDGGAARRDTDSGPIGPVEDASPREDASTPDAGDIEIQCDDAVDNDGDGLTDCDDPDCRFSCGGGGGFEWQCSDEVDNDGDGLTDCDDPDCNFACGGDGFEWQCWDGVDNDDDSLVDCDDPDCDFFPGCDGGGTEQERQCDDGVDNDDDGLTDCDDPDCNFACGGGGGGDRETDCEDGVDNDGDGQVDCDDFDCLLNPVCWG